MLVITVDIGERVTIGMAVVTVERVKGNRCKVSIDAPREVRVGRNKWHGATGGSDATGSHTDKTVHQRRAAGPRRGAAPPG